MGGLALASNASRFGTHSRRLRAIATLVVALVAVINGALNLAVASGGPGTGNGVVGGAAALVLGLVGLGLLSCPSDSRAKLDGARSLSKASDAGQDLVRRPCPD